MILESTSEIGEHAAQFARFVLIALLHVDECKLLALVHAIE